jgi:transcriptional regulator with XRE-family HTH domain
MTPADFTAARKRLGLTQAQFAVELGISTAHVARIEGGGTVTPTLAILVGLLLHSRPPNGQPGRPASS